MPIPMLNKENVVYKKEEDPTNTEIGLSESIESEDKKIESEDRKMEREGDGIGSGNESGNGYKSHDVAVASEESIDDIRRKIVDFIKSQGYVYTEGEREFDDETNDIFTKGGTLVELAITIGIDNEVIKQIVEETI